MSSRIAVFASGNGTNAEEIFKYFRGHPSIEVAVLMSNDPGAFALERAKKFNVPTRVFSRQQLQSGEVLKWLGESEVTHLVLAGFLLLVPTSLLDAFAGKVINIHPALLPKFGGKGMYGIKVHEQVKVSGEKETGITIHEVNERFDDGRILFQAKCPVNTGDSPEEIAGKVNRLEYLHYPKEIERWIGS